MAIYSKKDLVPESPNWEDHFPEAILSVEEYLARHEPTEKNQSKLKIALEQKYLSWTDYKSWALQYGQFPVLKNLPDEDLERLRKNYTETAKQYNHFNLWGTDLIPLTIWDEQLVVIGLEHNPEVKKALPNSVFLISSPEMITAIRVQKNQTQTPQKKNNNQQHVWINLEKNHEDFSLTARKKFDAYIVLKINSEQKTELYKMDEDLEKENLDQKIFSFDLKSENPFTSVYSNHFTETFNINQLNLKILDFKYACISAIKLGDKVVGFLVGFKTTHLSQDDITTLESISEKAV